MKRILINATHAEEIRVALCNGNHLYDFDLENRTREQKKANIYKGHVTRVEPSLEAVFVEYGSQRQGFLPIREIAPEYLAADPRSTNNIKQLIKEGDELIVQVEKEERGNKGAALSTMISLAGRYLVLMPNNARGGGISRQISGKLRDEMKQALSELKLPKGMSVIIRTAGIGKTSEDLQHDLDHLLTIWKGIQQQSQKYPSPRLMHQEAGVVTRAVRDYLRDDITEIWVDNEYAYNEAANFIEAVMPQQADKLRKYTDYEPMFARFGIEKQIETAYQREVRLPSGGSIVIDQTEALVSIDINSSKATKGADVSETAFNTNLEAADEIARQLRLRDMGGLIVIDFIDMATEDHQKQVENRIKEATKNDRARIQFAEISRFGLLEMSRQRLRPSLEEATGYLCPRCHGTGMIRDLRSLALSIMRQIEQKALQERQGEIQADVPTEIAAFLLNEKRDSLVYLEQESGTRITILPHAHLESPDFNITFNREGFAPSSYERVSESEQHENQDRGYDTTNWHTDDNEVSRNVVSGGNNNAWSNASSAGNNTAAIASKPQPTPSDTPQQPTSTSQPAQATISTTPTSAVAWLSNLFAPTQQAQVTPQFSGQDAAAAIESIVNTGAQSLGVQGQINFAATTTTTHANSALENTFNSNPVTDENGDKDTDRRKRGNRKAKTKKPTRYQQETTDLDTLTVETESAKEKSTDDPKIGKANELPKREPNSRRDSRGVKDRHPALTSDAISASTTDSASADVLTQDEVSVNTENRKNNHAKSEKNKTTKQRDPNTVQVQVFKTEQEQTSKVSDNLATMHISLDASKGATANSDLQSTSVVEEQSTGNEAEQAMTVAEVAPVEETKSALLTVAPTNGRAKNDPREVYKAYQARLTSATPSVITPVAKISGTVNQFINQYLDDATEKLANDSIVNCFIQAVAAFNNQSSAASNAATTTVTTDDENFGQYFRNYGYHSLSAQNLDDYHTSILPANKFQQQAGKTEANIPAVTKRARNDPRGPIVSDNGNQSVTKEVEAQTVPETLASTEIAQVKTAEIETATAAKAADYPIGTVGAWIVEHLGEQGHTLIQQGALVSAYLLAENSAQLAVTEEKQPLEKVAPSHKNEESVTVDEQVQDQVADKSNDLTSQKRKTTPVSYKNMIESVAEQMKPATVGMLTLATPKAPKTRTRKTKTGEKPAVKPKTRTSKKVENAVVVTKKSAATAAAEMSASQVETDSQNNH